MTEKFKYILNADTQNTASADYNYWLKSVYTQLIVKSIKIYEKSPKLLGQGIRKYILKLWGLV